MLLPTIPAPITATLARSGTPLMRSSILLWLRSLEPQAEAAGAFGFFGFGGRFGVLSPTMDLRFWLLTRRHLAPAIRTTRYRGGHPSRGSPAEAWTSWGDSLRLFSELRTTTNLGLP